MVLLIFLVTLVFACIGFFSNQPQNVIFNPLYTYYFYVLKFAGRNFGVFLSGFLVVGGWFLLKSKSNSNGNRLRDAAVPTVQVFLLGWLLSPILLFLVAFVELNILAVQFNINPTSLGVVSEKKLIVEKLKKMSEPPLIISGNKDQKAEVYALATALSGKDNFYGNFIVHKLPKFLVINAKKAESSLLLLDNTLIVKEISAGDMQEISPVIGYLFVSSNFTNRAIRSYPDVQIMSAEEYQKHRKTVFLGKIEEMGRMIREINDQSSSVSARLVADKDKAEANKKSIKQIYEKQDKDFYKCLNDNPTEVCEKYKNNGSEEALALNHENDELTSVIKANEKVLEDNKLYVDFLESQRKVGAALAANIPLERGAFDPPEKIGLTLGNADARTVADYFETLVHEYLHYASYVSEEKKFKDPFFEEGLTEYYARTAIKNDLNISTNLGYPAAALIIAKMTKRIPDSELSNIYFTKDQTGLEKLLDRVYGDNFYKNNIVFFNSLQYATDQRQMLLLSNIIMEKIGGEALTAEDLLSTFSNY